jgi:putative ABC transport system permease protein
MFRVAWKMLTGDTAKFLGLVVGVAFASFLMTQQVSVFMGILKRTASQVLDVSDANIWVMDPKVRFVDEVAPLPDTDLHRVRGVKGVDWAVRFFKGQGRVRLEDGRFQNVMVLGLDDDSYVAAPQHMLLGAVADLDREDAIIVDAEGWKLIWPHSSYELNREVQVNDRRGVIVGVCQASSPFTTMPVFYTRYSQTSGYIPHERDRMSYVLACSKPGADPAAVCRDIERQTGLQALTSDQFFWKTVLYYLRSTGIPINFGMTIVLGFVIGATVTGQTFYLFTVENLKQFGSLKAMGLPNPRIRRMILSQAATVGALGYALGIGAAAAFFTATKHAPHMTGIYVMPQAAALVACAVFAIIMLSAAWSIRRVLVLEPAEVFRG